MQKEELLKTIILLGILSVILIVHYSYYSYNGEINSIDILNYGKETVMFNYNPIEHYTNETLILLPPDWLLKLDNISVNKSI